MEQKYGNVPALLNVKENFSSVSRTFDLNTPSVLTTVWGISSRLVQVTVVPTDTLRVSGPKLKLSIVTSAFVPVGWSFAVTLGDSANSSNIAIITGVTRLAIHILLFLIFCFLSSLFSCLIFLAELHRAGLSNDWISYGQAAPTT